MSKHHMVLAAKAATILGGFAMVLVYRSWWAAVIAGALLAFVPIASFGDEQ